MTTNKDAKRRALDALNYLTGLDETVIFSGDLFDFVDTFEDTIRKALSEPEPTTCPKGDDCDLTIVYMKGFEDGKDANCDKQELCASSDIDADALRDGWKLIDHENIDHPFEIDILCADDFDVFSCYQSVTGWFLTQSGKQISPPIYWRPLPKAPNLRRIENGGG